MCLLGQRPRSERGVLFMSSSSFETPHLSWKGMGNANFHMDPGLISPIRENSSPFLRKHTCAHTLMRVHAHAVTRAIWPGSCLQSWWGMLQVCASVSLLHFNADLQSVYLSSCCANTVAAKVTPSAHLQAPGPEQVATLLLLTRTQQAYCPAWLWVKPAVRPFGPPFSVHTITVCTLR